MNAPTTSRHTAPTGLSPRRGGRARAVATVAIAGGLLLAAGVLIPGTAQAVNLPPSISGAPFPATLGQPYAFYFTLTGEPTPTCTLADGQLPAGLTLNQSDCLLTGTPAQPGIWGFGVTASNGVGLNAHHDTAVTVGQQPALSDPAVPHGTVGQPFNFQLPATGYPHPQVTWLGQDRLPDGLTLDLDGTIHGIPTTAQTRSNIQVLLTNDYGVDQEQLAMVIDPPAPHLEITSAAPPDVTAGQPYNFRFASTGASLPTFSTDQPLPSGLVLDIAGVLSGTTRQLGDFPITVVARSGLAAEQGLEARRDYTLHVVGSPLTLTGTPPSPAIVGLQYQFVYGRTGTPSSTTTVTDGALPPGLSLDDQGYINGWPTTPGTYTFTVTASNGGISTDVWTTSTIVVNQGSGILGIPPAASAGEPYAFAFTLAGSPTPTVRLSGGSLPDGLALSADGVLSGTPIRSGSFSFTLLADNGVTQVTSIQHLYVYPATPTATPTVRIADASRTEGNAGTAGMSFTISLSRPSTSAVTVHWSTVNGTARAGSDYYGASGTVTFAAGQTVKTVTVRIKGDRLREATETFRVRLGSPHGATVSDGTAVGRVVNDD